VLVSKKIMPALNGGLKQIKLLKLAKAVETPP
jgi:hypothetical protein